MGTGHESGAPGTPAAGAGMLLVHEWISQIGGSENVFRELLGIFPGADAGCLWNDVPETFAAELRESRLASSRIRGKKALSLPLMPAAWRDFPIDGYEAVLASSHAFSHHLASRAARDGKRGFAYVHTPARYVWAPEVEARGQGVAARLGSPMLKRIDRRAVDPRVEYAANSEYIRDRIRRCWDVDAQVIYPPVNVERIQSVERWRDVLSADEEKVFAGLPGDGFILGASRLVSYKRLDLVIQLGEALGQPVVIAGAGPDKAELQALAEQVSVPVHFVGRVSDQQLYALYQEASLFVFLAIEDFGIMPVECMATGTPVLVNPVGGARESVIRLGGAVAQDIAMSSLVRGAEQAIGFNMELGKKAAAQFSHAAFASGVAKWTGVLE